MTKAILWQSFNILQPLIVKWEAAHLIRYFQEYVADNGYEIIILTTKNDKIIKLNIILII